MRLFTVYLLLFFNITLFAKQSYSVNTNSLKEAIIQISKQAKFPYLVDVSILKDKKANPIKNIKSIDKAFSLLLKNTGLEAVIDNKTIVIRQIKKKQELEENLNNQVKEIKSITVIGKQKSYYEEYSNVSMKREARDIEIPYTTNVSNQTLIKDIQALRVEDLYSYTTGVFDTDSRADGIIIRGFEINLQNIQLNGMPGLISRFGSPSTAYVDKVEILKGPASLFYGNMEGGGLIYIQNKKPQGKNQITYETSYSTYASGISKVAQKNSIVSSLDIEGTFQDDLYYRFIVQKDKIESFRKGIEYNNLYLYPSLTWELSDNSLVEFSFEYGKEKGSADDGLVVINNDISTHASLDTVYQEDGDLDNDKGLAFNTNIEHLFKDDSVLNISFRSVLHEDERRLYENRSVNDDEKTLLRRFRHQYNERDWHSLDANYLFKTNSKNFIHDIIVGGTVNYRKTDYDRRAWGGNLEGISIYNPVYKENSTVPEGNRRKTEYKSLALYLQNKIALSSDFNLVLAGRFDKTKVNFDCIRGENRSCIDNSTNNNNFVGSIGAVYNITPFISAYTNISQGYDTFTSERVDINAKPLDAEKSEQVEIGAKFNINEQFNATVSTYKINKKNLAEKISFNRYKLTGEVESKGLEVDVQWLPTSNFQLKAGVSFNNSKYIAGSSKGQEMANNPENAAFIFGKYNLPVKVLDGTLGFSSGISYKSFIYTHSNKEDAVKLPSYTKADLGIHYDRKDWGLSLNIENITNKKYFKYGNSDRGIYPGEPRKVTFNFKKTF